MIPDERVQSVREFNRFYTRVLGVLAEGLNDTPYSLTESRVLFELSQRESTEVTALRRDLGLDAGYLSRLLARFESDGLVSRDKSATDARRQVAGLTEAGQSTMKMLNERSDAEVHRLLDPLGDDDQRELVAAMDVIRRRLTKNRQDNAVVLRPPRPGDLGWVVERNGALYAQEHQWGATYEAVVARIVADYAAGHDPAREAGWIAEINGERAGSVFCTRKDNDTAKLRLLLVEPSARGMGVGGRLVDECLRFATSVGYRTIELWTMNVLISARRIYQSRGFTLVESEHHDTFAPGQTAETWRKELYDR
ncbi:bifunctional helix-turn-helix transcriptional regulator/GNAT family N-acetyltransferase [Kibdelosporangium phytohabitans]|uniref:MarR family transcriptional regulator n=1 Tax=Kibdelosporangium phytohabitans TaxID=860235 RepID=A0A0N7F5I8_9PSEU|nr:helix-turn-helix domain-containing GNAT family N-acetyltransferase [Kibdelosporangium phytohabitans]ALG14351.1 MarR family transcriptional regulator [Kibdelosporangium phytohabitans]MBE1466620.1 DNA-binding MarR family transcriptional regulator/GNAT superfamily N-acetyltransferase [Kibdelosporangium phytohabitans]